MEKRQVMSVSDVKAVVVKCRDCGGELRKTYDNRTSDLEGRPADSVAGCFSLTGPDVFSSFLAALDAYRQFVNDAPVDVTFETDVQD